MDAGLYVVMATLDAIPGQRGALTVAARRNAAQSMSHEEGCVGFDVLHDCDNPDRVHLFTVFTSEEAFAAHRDTSHFHEWLTTSAHLLDPTRAKIHRRAVSPPL
ncbi:MAG: putative quinol monooxygenase [Aeromicrobium sp.]